MGEESRFVSSGIPGLDRVLGGGFPPGALYLVRGVSGTGKTTMGLQFLIEGVRRGEKSLFIGTTESREQLETEARSHGWSLDGVAIHVVTPEAATDLKSPQSIMHTAEIDLPVIIDSIFRAVNETNARRVVIDSLDEIRVLARELGWYRRQLFALKEFFAARNCTVFLTEVPNVDHSAVDSVVSGIIDLERFSPAYGPVRRRIQIAKLRAQSFESGYHDYRIRTGGIVVFPRLVASANLRDRAGGYISSGIPELDKMVGGEGLDRGSTALFVGPAGTGKSTLAAQFVVAAAQRGEASAIYCFDERLHTFYQRAEAIGLPIEKYVRDSLVTVTQVDPAEMSPGEFSHHVQMDVEEDRVKVVMIDSLNGYAHAMPAEQFLSVHLHELSSYLNQRSVTTLLTMAQHGIFGAGMETPFEVSYISDTVFLLRLFEHKGAIQKAISTHKRRGGFHEQEIRRLDIGSNGIIIGESMEHFRGVLSGIPEVVGSASKNDR